MADSGAVDPRAEWPMAPLHALLRYVEWHAQHGRRGHAAGQPGDTPLLPHEIQLYAELVARHTGAQPRRPRRRLAAVVRGVGLRLRLGQRVRVG